MILIVFIITHNKNRALELICIWLGPIMSLIITMLTFYSLADFKKITKPILNTIAVCLLIVYTWIVSPFLFSQYHLLISMFLTVTLFVMFVVFDIIAINKLRDKYEKERKQKEEIEILLKYVDGPTACSLLLFLVLVIVVYISNALPNGDSFDFFCHGGLSFHVLFAIILLVWATPESLTKPLIEFQEILKKITKWSKKKLKLVLAVLEE